MRNESDLILIRKHENRSMHNDISQKRYPVTSETYFCENPLNQEIQTHLIIFILTIYIKYRHTYYTIYRTAL